MAITADSNPAQETADQWRDAARWLRERAKVFSGTAIEKSHNEHADRCDQEADAILRSQKETVNAYRECLVRKSGEE